MPTKIKPPTPTLSLIAARVGNAMGHPSRSAILERLLSGGEMTCANATRGLNLCQATTSHHLKVLHQAGLIHRRKDPSRNRWAVWISLTPVARAVLASVAAEMKTAA